MAQAVVDAVSLLVDKGAQTADRKTWLESEKGRIAAAIAKAQSEKTLLMGEYASGMFCSGCNQTRSQILAKGETFPHAGQSIVRPTAEQIARREAELDLPIRRLSEELAKTEKEIEAARQLMVRLGDQLGEGNRLWLTALSLADGLLDQARVANKVYFGPQLIELERGVEVARKQVRAASGSRDFGEKQDANIELESALRARDAAQKRLDLNQRQIQLQYERFSIMRRSHEGSWFEWLAKLTSKGMTCSCQASLSRQASDTPPLGLGIYFQMGRVPSLSDSWPPSPLSRVSAFIADFKSAKILGWRDLVTNPGIVRGQSQTPPPNTSSAPPASQRARLLGDLPP